MLMAANIEFVQIETVVIASIGPNRLVFADFKRMCEREQEIILGRQINISQILLLLLVAWTLRRKRADNGTYNVNEYLVEWIRSV